jgi:hypothetical protein
MVSAADVGKYVDLITACLTSIHRHIVGNRRFRDAITSSIDEYNSSDSRLAKSRVVQRIVETIKGGGGRFLKKDRASGQWVGKLGQPSKGAITFGALVCAISHMLCGIGLCLTDAELDTKSCRDKVGHAIRDAANLLEARKEKQQRKKGGSEGKGNLRTSSPFEDDGEEREFSSRYDDDEDEIVYGSFSEGKLDDEPSLPALPPRRAAHEVDPEDDPFVRHINEVLGPIPTNGSRDPLQDLLDNLGRTGSR